MGTKNIIEEMHKILKYVGKECTIIPTLLKETFDELIKKRVKPEDKSKIENENMPPALVLEEDVDNNLYLSYYDGNGNNLQILDEDKDYFGMYAGIKVENSTFLHEFEGTMKKKKIETAKVLERRQAELFKKVESGEITLDVYANYIARVAKELSLTKTPEEYLEKILNYYREKLGDKTYRINCDIAKKDGVDRGPRQHKSPIRKSIELDVKKRTEGIKNLIPNYEEIIINNGECYAYLYDLSQNGNDENGCMIIVEPEKNGVATKVIYLSEKNLKDKKHNKNVSDIELKAEYLKEILEETSKINEIKRINHGDYGKWLAIIDYYLKGEKTISPELRENINDKKFEAKYPRDYLRDSRRKLMEEEK